MISTHGKLFGILRRHYQGWGSMTSLPTRAWHRLDSLLDLIEQGGGVLPCFTDDGPDRIAACSAYAAVEFMQDTVGKSRNCEASNRICQFALHALVLPGFAGGDELTPEDGNLILAGLARNDKKQCIRVVHGAIVGEMWFEEAIGHRIHVRTSSDTVSYVGVTYGGFW